jgi:hypothetical protein
MSVETISSQMLSLRSENPRAGASVKGKNISLFYHHQFCADTYYSYYSVGITIRKNRYTYMAEMNKDEFIEFFSNKLVDEYYYSLDFDDSDFMKKIDPENKFHFVGDDCD